MSAQNNQIWTGLQSLPVYDLYAQMFLETKDPTSANYTTRPYRNFQIGTFWLNTTNQNLWYLADIQTSPKVEGNWVMLSSGSSGTVDSLSGNIGSNPVFPILGNIKVFGDGIGINISGDGVNTLTASLIGGGVAAQSFPTDFGTATPDAAGVLNIKAQTATLGAGSSVSFSAPGPSNTVQLNVTDALANTIVGNLAGNLTLTGIANTSLGASTLAALTTGQDNTAIGNSALAAVTTGQNNTALGRAALQAFQSSTGNTAVGFLAAGSLISGSNNTAMGGQALVGLTTGTSNTVVGLNAGASYTGSDSANIVIGVNPGRVGEAGVIRVGNTVLQAGANIFLGNASGNNTYTVASAVNNVGIGATSLAALTVGTSNTGLGFGSLQALTSGITNVGLGYQSLQSLTSTNNNTGAGYNTLVNLVTGENNIAVGATAGSSYTGAESNNILLGSGVLGTLGESNACRIGLSTGSGANQLNKTFIAGINGVTSSNPLMVTINSATDQLGVAAVPSGVGNSILTVAGTQMASIASVTWIQPYYTSGTSVQSNAQMIVPKACTISNLYVNVYSNMSTANTTVTLNKNGVNTALAVTITALTNATFSNLVNTVTYAAGDTIQFEFSQATTGSVSGILSANLAA